MSPNIVIKCSDNIKCVIYRLLEFRAVLQELCIQICNEFFFKNDNLTNIIIFQYQFDVLAYYVIYLQTSKSVL